MVESGDSAHDTGAAGAVFAGDLVRTSVTPGTRAESAPSDLVSERGCDLLRYVGLRAAAALASQDFLVVTRRPRCSNNSEGAVGAPDRHARIRGLIWTKSNYTTLAL